MGTMKTCIVKFIRNGVAGYNVIVAETYARNFTYAQWQTYGAVGHLENWVSITNAAKFKPGDTIVIVGTCTDRNNAGVNLYATVVSVSGTTVSATSTSLIMGGDKGDKGEKTSLRGPQAWNDCAVGYPFMQGKDGEKFIDLVMYGEYFYECAKSHTKTASNYPGSTADKNNGYWKLGDKVNLIASRILLATYALVKNLGVEAIEMKDANGNILFQAKDGNVTCKTGTFQNCVLEGYFQTKFTNVGSESFTISNLLNIATPGGFYDQVIYLPHDASFIGKRVCIINTNYPPYSRTSIGYFTKIQIDATLENGGIGIGGNIDVDASSTNYPASIKSFNLRGGMVELVAVPMGYENSNLCRWVLVNGKHSIMSYTTF